MNIEFFDAYPFAEMGTRLRELYRGARRVEAAIAFVSAYGVERWLELLQAPEPPEARLVVSVRFPTQLAALCRLEPRMAGNLFIHTGYDEPLEKYADRGQLHSKVVLIDYGNGECAAVVGSHNWTEYGLRGVNLEAGVVIHCGSSEPIARQIRQHIDECAARSERFDPKRLRYYATIQAALQVGPASPESDDFEGFEALDAVVIHAEDETPSGPPEPVQLFLRVHAPVPAGFFARGRQIQLFLYRKGSLFGHETPTHSPTAFGGTITMENTVADAPVDARSVNCRIDNFDQPQLLLEPGGNIPEPAGERVQVVARLECLGPAELPIFHCAPQSPKMKLDVETREVDRDLPRNALPASLVEKMPPATQSPHSHEYRYTAPTHLIVKCRIRMPIDPKRRGDVEARLASVLYASDFLKSEDVPEIIIDEPKPENMLNQYVYAAYFRLTAETIARIQRQRSLFE